MEQNVLSFFAQSGKRPSTDVEVDVKRPKSEEREEKKRLRDQEKLQARLDRDEARIKEKQKKEEERLKKKLRKEEERLKEKLERSEKKRIMLDQKKRAKEDARREKEDARREREEQEKLKKKEQEKKQPTLTSFFTLAKPCSEDSGTKESCYDKYFLEFYQKGNVAMKGAGKSLKSLEEYKTLFDSELFQHHQSASLDDYFKSLHIHRGFKPAITALDIIQKVNTDDSVSESMMGSMIAQLPQKFLKFYENNKPPYCGSFSATTSTDLRDPFQKLADASIDYDENSDYEIDDEEDAEDLGDEEDEDEEEFEEHDSDNDFVSEDPQINSTKHLGPKVPLLQLSHDIPMGSMCFHSLLLLSHPIDPFYDYWSSGSSPGRKKTSDQGSSPTRKGKSVIQNSDEVAKLTLFIKENADFSLNTLVELMKKQLLPNHTKMMLKNSVQHYAQFQPKAKVWEVRSLDEC